MTLTVSYQSERSLTDLSNIFQRVPAMYAGKRGREGKTQNTSHNMHFGGAEWGSKVNSALFFASIIKRFTATYYRSTISSMFSAACRTAIFRCIVAFFVRVVEATTGPTADIFAHLCLKRGLMGEEAFLTAPIYYYENQEMTRPIYQISSQI